MNKYYSSELLTDDCLISKDHLSDFDFYYHSTFNRSLGCIIAEEIFANKINRVLYYDVKEKKEIMKYHESKYGEIRQCFFYNLSPDDKSLETYMNGVFHSKWIFHYREYKLQNSILLDNVKNLIEYRQCIYNESGKQILEKIFYPDSWTIHSEKI